MADDVLLPEIVLAYDRKFIDVEPRPLEFFDARFGLGVGVANPYTVLCSAMVYLRPLGFNVG